MSKENKITQRWNSLMAKSATATEVSVETAPTPEQLEGNTAAPLVAEPKASPSAEIGKQTDATNAKPTDLGDQLKDVPTITDVENPQGLPADIKAYPEVLVKAASNLLNVAEAIKAIPVESLNAAWTKEASAPVDTVGLICKLASEGDLVASNYVQYAMLMEKIASDTDELVASGMSPEEAEAIAVEANIGTENLEQPEVGGDAEAIAAEQIGMAIEQNAQAVAEELATEIMTADPSVAPEEAIDVASEIVAETISEIIEGEGVAEAAADATEDVPVDPAVVEQLAIEEVNAVADQLTAETAQQIMAADPSVDEQTAVTVAAEAVADALGAAQTQEALTAVDETGAPVVSDEEALMAMDEMAKTASAFPARGELASRISNHFGVNQELFEARAAHLINGGK